MCVEIKHGFSMEKSGLRILICLHENVSHGTNGNSFNTWDKKADSTPGAE